uniref:1-acyl-sn-glycerol-3-phosphate acyltransferase n=1 Tax=Gasterosteus aculeatus aculeatus TaxID=481459 RepID=G3PTP9_GASAC|nr:1-acyl-sn-glycerol-3-phosphate acyltransferase beta [Gasterosteus aculeatus aculeatus]
MDVLWLIPLLLVPLLMWSSGTFVFYFKKCFYVGWMMVLALLAIPLCMLKSGGRDVENMRIIRVLVRHVKYFLGLRFDVSGWEHLQTEGPYVIISNHQSSLDVLGLMEILPDRCTMIAKKELVYAGTVGLICWLGGIVFINRKKTSDAKSVMAEAAQTMLDQQIRLWVFPEGTRNQKEDLLPFKKGAFHLAVQAQVPIIPVVFSSYRNFYLRKEKRFNSGTVRLRILPKIETKGMTSDDISSLCDKSFDLMQAAFRERLRLQTHEQRAVEGAEHSPRSRLLFPPTSPSETCLPRPPVPLPAPPPLLSPRFPIAWPCHEISSCLVDAWSGRPLARPVSAVCPDPHCACSSSSTCTTTSSTSTSSSAALQAVSGMTDGRIDACCSSCMTEGSGHHQFLLCFLPF